MSTKNTPAKAEEKTVLAVMPKTTVNLKPKEFGLSVKEGNAIAKAFSEDEAKFQAIILEYNELIKKPITPETELEAAALDKRLQKIDSGVSSTHKIEKATFLSSGRYCDAIKNRTVKPVAEMRETTKAIAKHTENKLKKEQEELEASRITELTENGVEQFALPAELGQMDLEVYNMYLSGVKAADVAKKAAAKKAEEDAAAEKKKKDKEAAQAEAEAEKTRKANKALKAKNDKLAAQVQAQKDKDAAEATRKAAEAEADLKKGDSDKINDLITDLEAIPTKYEFKSERNKKLYTRVNELIENIVKGLKE